MASSTPAPNGAAAGSGGLRVNNSLNPGGEKAVFVPRNGRQVTWYICGPTVYDSAHVGHARTYLAFDIIRRILEDYFGYSVFYVMNVTDVDDKIIARARGDYLLEQYLKETKDPQQAVEDISQALGNTISSLAAKVADLKSTLASAATQKLKEDLEEQAGQEELKLEQRQGALATVRNALGPAACQAGTQGQSAEVNGGVRLLLDKAAASERAALAGASAADWEAAVEHAREALAGALFKTRGSSITDLSIFRKHAARYEAEFLGDMKALGVRPPHVLTRVTEYIDPIIKYVEKIVGRGFAYESNGSVYFDCKSFSDAGHEYGKLCPWAVNNTELAAESEANFASAEKRNKSDFALWKKSKPGEPTWDSPWGPGRPGWHIECSAMASDILGDVMDIHSGGIDLRFPHHSNELAQAEAYYDSHEWVRYFLHTGHLHIEGRKMSKSLKNFITIREALAQYSARQIRMLFLMQAWDKNMNFGEGALEEAAKRERQFRIFFQTVQAECRGTAQGEEAEEWWGPPEKALSDAIAKAEDDVRVALEDNFDTASALLALLALVSATNVYISTAKAERATGQGGQVVRPILLQRASDFVARILNIFGLNEGERAQGGLGTSAGAGEASESREQILGPVARAFSAFRDAVRAAAIRNAPKEELLALTDRVRDFDMVELGIRCEDRPGGAAALAELDDPQLLRRERDERLRQAAAEAVKKLQTKHTARLKELQKWEAASAPADGMFRSATDKYSAWDEQGLPTHDAQGKELSGKARKGAEKDAKKQEEAHAKFKAKLEEDSTFLEKLRAEVQQLEGDLARLSAGAST